MRIDHNLCQNCTNKITEHVVNFNNSSNLSLLYELSWPITKNILFNLNLSES